MDDEEGLRHVNVTLLIVAALVLGALAGGVLQRHVDQVAIDRVREDHCHAQVANVLDTLCPVCWTERGCAPQPGGFDD